MQHKPLHIVSFDNPYPPDYGGTIEIYYKLKALKEFGYSIYLHCFTYTVPKEALNLEELTEKLYFYKISYNPLHLFSRLPFSVRSRCNKQLITNLSVDKAPILFESLKTTFLAGHHALSGFDKILRLHNIEQDYFKGIAKSESNLIKRILYRQESRKYLAYDSMMCIFKKVITLSYFENNYVEKKCHNSYYIPVFHGNNEVANLHGTGDYALYHGDLRTPDNKEAVRYLIDIFKDINYPLVIASGSNGKFVKRLIGKSKNITFIQIRDFTHLKDLLNKAHINLIISLQRSGTKLKLINALYHSRFCVINENIIDDPAIEGLCIRAVTAKEITNAVQQLLKTSYSGYENRKKILKAQLNDTANAIAIDKLIYGNNE